MYITEQPIVLKDFFSSPVSPSAGAMASFVGVVRNHDHGRAVQKLYYECYQSMANSMIHDLIEKAKAQWALNEIRILHRVGILAIGEVAVAIAVSAAHRDEAFLACRFLIEEIKKNVPIWKKEFFEDGTSQWVICSHLQQTV